jgi:hypothetical protein
MRVSFSAHSLQRLRERVPGGVASTTRFIARRLDLWEVTMEPRKRISFVERIRGIDFRFVLHESQANEFVVITVVRL